MGLKSTKLYGILTGTCPQCHEGKVFLGHPYKLSKMTKVHHHCDKCGLKFEPEPQFFQGAMYVSYAFSVGIVVAIFVGAQVLYDELPINAMIFWGIFSAIFLAPLNLRISRSIWLALFVKYRPEKKEFYDSKD